MISCECLISYHVPDGGDPFDGCIEQSVAGGTSRGGGGGGGAARPPSSRSVHITEATIPPLSTLGSVVRESADQPSAVPRALDNTANTNRLQAGHRPGQLLPRRKTKPAVDFEDVDTKELFPEGRIHFDTIKNIRSSITVSDCLVHEDCEENEFCSPPPENKCVDACTLDGEETCLTV